MQSDLESLIKRVECAGDLDPAQAHRLDLAIYDALKPAGNCLRYSTSLDASLALVAEKLPGRGSDCLRLALITNDRDHPIIGKKFERDPIDVSEMARRVIVALLRALQSQGDKNV